MMDGSTDGSSISLLERKVPAEDLIDVSMRPEL